MGARTVSRVLDDGGDVGNGGVAIDHPLLGVAVGSCIVPVAGDFGGE